MSLGYDNYIERHKTNVLRAFNWFDEHLPEIFDDDEFKAQCRHQCEFAHDHSKYSEEEYEPYDVYFYGRNKSFQVIQDFNYAWLTHIHRNPHHWQYWVLMNDNPNEGEIILDMPNNYIIEMVCDWWSFSWKEENLREIFAWYDKHSEYMKLSDKTRKKVEYILKRIREELDKSDEDEN
jgi:hypothetical protein